MKNTTLLILFMLCVSSQLFAQSVRLRTDIDLSVSGTTSGGNNIVLNVEGPSGDATAEAAPATIYVPIENTVSQTHLYYVNASSGSPTTLFNTGVATDFINIPLRIITISADYYLYAAIKDTTDSNKYKIIKQYSVSPMNQGETFDVVFPFAPLNICAAIASECTNLVANSNSPTEKSFTVYFFLSTAASYGVNEEVDIATAPLNNGIYFQISMSNRVYSDADLRITINSGRAGDKRVILNYKSTGTLASAYAKSVKVFTHSSDPVVTNEPIGTVGYTGVLRTQDFPYAQSGEITVNELTNSSEATLSIVFLDKFNFVTTLSKEIKATPLEIQELLRKNSCFLLTAGFGEDHYIIDYFRQLRDNVLANSYLGRSFIHAYYELAPKYALMIYQHEGLRAFVRLVGYGLYFLFSFYYIFLGLLIGGSGYFIYSKTRKSVKTL